MTSRQQQVAVLLMNAVADASPFRLRRCQIPSLSRELSHESLYLGIEYAQRGPLLRQACQTGQRVRGGQGYYGVAAAVGHRAVCLHHSSTTLRRLTGAPPC